MKLAIVAGNIIIEEAKMGGITPDVLILSGKCVLCPPYILRPTIRLAYWTGIRRWPRSTNMMTPTTTTMSANSINTRKAPISPVVIKRKVLLMAFGMRATIPANIMRDIPLPIPRSVICSPNHMIKAVPAVKVRTVIKRKLHPG